MSAAGKFREVITIITPASVTTTDALGTIAVSTATSVTRWAAVEMLPAKEELVDGKVIYHQPYQFTLRYDAAITPMQRLEWKGKKISITSVRFNKNYTEIYLNGIERNS
ncbi:phage head closure protein [Hymenobacter sublimis]|uniref:Phage head closure protein n=1 Tax=Hymenobacter sublimis TaxID=2933777 RepID=A0ABY4JCI9_9BACT|nr:phage head closure protein [Hymenobacter sublimis]UPL50526.1 phage head closure protein [Hymenobacter sublimis]